MVLKKENLKVYGDYLHSINRNRVIRQRFLVSSLEILFFSPFFCSLLLSILYSLPLTYFLYVLEWQSLPSLVFIIIITIIT